MLAWTGNGELIQQSEIIKTKHLDEAWWCFLSFFQIQPAVELFLRKSGGAVDTGNAVLQEGSIIPLGGKGYLVTQVSEAVIDRSGRKH